jgi:hypothetical protein
MNTDRDDAELEQILKTWRPAVPAPGVRERVTAAALDAWGAPSGAVPWPRLWLSAAAALVIVTLSGRLNDVLLNRWTGGGSLVAEREEREEPSELAGVSAGWPAWMRGGDGVTLAGQEGPAAADRRQLLRELLNDAPLPVKGPDEPPSAIWRRERPGRQNAGLQWS